MLAAVPKIAMPALLEAIDIAFIGLQPQALFRFGISPNKLMDYMMAGKPIIQSVSSGNDLVTEVGCGITVPPNNAKLIAEAVIKLSKLSKDDLYQMGQRGALFVSAKRSYAVLSDDFIKILEK